MNHNASAYPKGYSDKLDYIDRVINALVTEQLKAMAEQLKAAQTQTTLLQSQYGKGRRS